MGVIEAIRKLESDYQSNPTFEKLAELREAMMVAHKANNATEGIQSLLTDLYPDEAHFIDELLQNAEDTQATEVWFTLNYRDLLFKHNGTKKQFSIEDVDAITNIGHNQSKKDDHTSIGKFGIGFKSVFAYTDCPEIHSGEFDFCIKDYFMPVQIGQENVGDNTLFRFPIKENKISELRTKIADRLSSFNYESLLFLKNIAAINFEIEGGSRGKLYREEDDGNHIIIRTQINEERKKSEWLRFTEDYGFIDDRGSSKSGSIGVAYLLERNEKDELEIKPCKEGKTFVYFPARKETSNLKFHVNAPFASTVARDSIRKCEENDKLIKELANLIENSLLEIKNAGLLSTSLLTVMPNRSHDVGENFIPIRKAIVHAFKTQELTPVYKTGNSDKQLFAPADDLLHGSPDLKRLINQDDLMAITGDEEKKWVINVRQRNQDDDKFITDLGIDYWTPIELVNAFFCNQSVMSDILKSKDDDWLRDLYAFIYKEALDSDECKPPKRQYSCIPLKEEDAEKQRRYENFMCQLSALSIVAVEQRGERRFVKSQEAYLSIDDSVMHLSSDIATIPPSLYRSSIPEEDNKRNAEKFLNAKEFFIKLGITKYDTERYWGQYLSKYDDAQIMDITIDEHLEHIRLYFKLKEGKLKFVPYLLAHKQGKDDFLNKLSDNNTYIDNDSNHTGLRALEAVLDLYELSSIYESELDNELYKRFLDSAMPNLRTKLRLETNAGGSIITSVRDIEKRFPSAKIEIERSRRGKGRVHKIVDYESDEFSKIVDSLRSIPTKQRSDISKALWNTACNCEEYIDACLYVYAYSTPVTGISMLVEDYMNTAWIVGKDGGLYRPCEMNLDNLQAGFSYDSGNKFLQAIHFGGGSRDADRNDEIAKFWAGDNASPEDITRKKKYIELVEKYNVPLEELEELLEKHEHSQPEEPKAFPSKTNPNPERRDGILSGEGSNADDRGYEKRARSVKKTKPELDQHEYLESNYTNDDDEFVCQICEKTVFIKRDESPSYAAVSLFTNDVLQTEHQVLFLGLCQICAAKYKEYIKNAKRDAILLNELESVDTDYIDEDEGCLIPIELDERSNPSSIHFTYQHICDIQSVLSGIDKRSDGEENEESDNEYDAESDPDDTAKVEQEEAWIGSRVYHGKYGYGVINAINEKNHFFIAFDNDIKPEREFPENALDIGLFVIADDESNANSIPYDETNSESADNNGPSTEEVDLNDGEYESEQSAQSGHVEYNLLDEILLAGIEYEDNRNRDGGLWIIGGQELQDFVKVAGRHGYHFAYKPDRRRGRPGWWLT
jgi:hypothetical protein